MPHHSPVVVILVFIFVLGIMVLVHETGHFVVAKLCGVRVEVFSIGFGKRLIGFRYGDTDYRLSLLPLGGYVKMAGEYGAETRAGAPDEFTSQPRWQRILIGLAGPAANIVLSLFLLTLVSHYHYSVDEYLSEPAVIDYVVANSPAAKLGMQPGDLITSFGPDANPTWGQVLTDSSLHLNGDVPVTFTHNGAAKTVTLPINVGDPRAVDSPDTVFTAIGLVPREQSTPIAVTDVNGGSPAALAGLKPNDQIVTIDGITLHSVDAIKVYLQDRKGAPAALEILRGGTTQKIVATPQLGICGPNQYCLGFSYKQPPTKIQRLPLGAAIKQSFADNRDDSTLIFRVLKGMFTRQVSPKQLMGPIGIEQQVGVALDMGPWTLMRLTSTISMNLAIFNLLPFPPLDGAMILFLIIESIMRRDVNEVLKERIYQVAFVGLVVFACFVFYNDIARLHLGH